MSDLDAFVKFLQKAVEPEDLVEFQRSVARMVATGKAHRPPTINEQVGEGGHRIDPLAEAEREERILRRFRVMAVESGMQPRNCTETDLFAVFNEQPRHESLHQMELMIGMTPSGYWERRGL